MLLLYSMLCFFTYFSFKVLFEELRNVDSVVEGTDKLMKAFLHCISNGKLDYTSEDVREMLSMFLILIIHVVY